MYRNNAARLANDNAETQTIRETTIVQHLAHVRALARRLQSRVPRCVTVDDLVSAGAIGLMQAVDRFQPARGLQFGTYAGHRIWGAMLRRAGTFEPSDNEKKARFRA